MNLPRIYSLSTVGILKHSHQDYLLHPVRTDFIGSNGVGKSIIADLLQLIFITDRNLVKFGTDSLTNERKIETLPYGGNEGYAFLNVEVSPDRFITFGVCIPARTGVALKPFVILSQPDLYIELKKNSYYKNKLLMAKDFLNHKNGVLDLRGMVRKLRDEYQLYLTYFQYREEILRYYTFLYNHEILPINLSR